MVDTTVRTLVHTLNSGKLIIVFQGTCKQCKRGYNQMCDNAVANGINRDGGCMSTLSGPSKNTSSTDQRTVAEYCILRSEATVHIPSDVDPAAYAPLLCAGVTVFNSMRQMKIASGETVAIQGLGGLGHLAIQYANRMGFKVVALSSTGAKEKFAKDLGAHVYIDGSKEDHAEALQKMGGAAMIVSTAPNPDIMGNLVNGLGPLGKLVLLARKHSPLHHLILVCANMRYYCYSHG